MIRRIAVLALSIATIIVPMTAAVRGASPDETKVQLALAEREVLGLPADRATIEAIMRSGADAGTEQWGIVLTADELASLDLPGRAEFANQVSEHALAYAKSLSTYGGAYVDQRAGGSIVINLTAADELVEQRIRAMSPTGSRSVRVRIVEHTHAALVTAAERARDAWAELSEVQLVSVAVDEVANGLKLGVAPQEVTVAAEAAAEVTRLLGVPVQIVEKISEGDLACTARNNCYKPFKAGIKIDNDEPLPGWTGTHCTIGFHVVLNNGDRQALTAGHCGVGATSDWWHWGTGSNQRIQFANTMYPDVERDIMRLNPSDGHTTDEVYYVIGGFRQVTSARAPMTNETVCASQARSDAIDCGFVTDEWTDWTSSNCGCQMWGASTSGITGMLGDSGSPVYVPSGGSGVVAVGLQSQASHFAHVMSALNWWDISILD